MFLYINKQNEAKKLNDLKKSLLKMSLSNISCRFVNSYFHFARYTGS